MSVRFIFLVLIFVAVGQPVQAGKVSTLLPSGIAVNAVYVPGDPEKPALVVLHGFLQTNEFLATENMINGLSDMGYPVLGPSLSLDVGNRRKSLPCEALHKHTLASDIGEIDVWVNWLFDKGHTSVVLVGHSWGGQHALAYAENFRERELEAVIAVSLVRTPQPMDTIRNQLKQAQELINSGKPELGSYELNFCKKYKGTPASYLSYAEWTDARVLASVASSRVPVHVILGGADRRIDDEWMASLGNSGAGISVIDDADHFFSSTYEFDLIDELQVVLTKLELGK